MNRYTTIIDIRDTSLYASPSARLLYLHLCLSSGYHKDDQDEVRQSVRQLSREVGVSVSAIRCAMSSLVAAGLLRREGGRNYVCKFVRPVIAARGSAKVVSDGTEEAAALQEERDRLQEELAKLRRWWQDAKDRGDSEACQGIQKQAAKIKNQLKAMG